MYCNNLLLQNGKLFSFQYWCCGVTLMYSVEFVRKPDYFKLIKPNFNIFFKYFDLQQLFAFQFTLKN